MFPQHLVMLCPTLVDQGGHEYDYTAMIASAALARGMETISVVPSRTSVPITLPGRVSSYCRIPLTRNQGFDTR